MIGFHAPVCILEKQEALGQPDMIALSTFLKEDSLLHGVQQSVFVPLKADYLVKDKIQFTIPEAGRPTSKVPGLASSHMQMASRHKRVVGRACTRKTESQAGND